MLDFRDLSFVFYFFVCLFIYFPCFWPPSYSLPDPTLFPQKLQEWKKKYCTRFFDHPSSLTYLLTTQSHKGVAHRKAMAKKFMEIFLFSACIVIHDTDNQFWDAKKSEIKSRAVIYNEEENNSTTTQRWISIVK